MNTIILFHSVQCFCIKWIITVNRVAYIRIKISYIFFIEFFSCNNCESQHFPTFIPHYTLVYLKLNSITVSKAPFHQPAQEISSFVHREVRYLLVDSVKICLDIRHIPLLNIGLGHCSSNTFTELQTHESRSHSLQHSQVIQSKPILTAEARC